jgi:serine/threonine-protein kinase RsbT
MNSPHLISAMDAYNCFFERTGWDPSLQCEISIRAEADLMLARLAIRETSSALGFGLTDTTRIVTAGSELARNLYQYAGRGVMRVRSLEATERQGIELEFEDQGPGIPDLDQAMGAGFSTSGGSGMGLPGAKRLMDEMRICSSKGAGTTISLRKWRRA